MASINKLVWTSEGRPLCAFVNEVLDELRGTKTNFEVHMEGGHILRFTIGRKRKTILGTIKGLFRRSRPPATK
jgi:hypothetical protein